MTDSTPSRVPPDLQRIGFLGPQGTFTQMALAAWAGDRTVDQVPCSSVDQALAALRSGQLDGAMVPIENSVEGGVSATLDV